MNTKLLALCGMALLCTNSLFAAPADLDLTFGASGSTVGSHLGATYYDAAIQADGKIVVFGVDNRPGMFLSRYLPDGTLDTSFSVDGIEDVDFGSGSAIGKDLVIQPDGKLLVMSWSSGDGNGDVGVARYNTDGTLDVTFGGDGTIVQSLRSLINPGGGISYDVPDAMALQPDGKILVTGLYKESTQDQLFVLRLNSDGTPDTSFRTVGAFRYTLGQQSVQYGHDIMVKPDGKIVVLGKSWTGGSSYDSLVLVLNPDGTHDFDFVGSGSGWVLGLR